MSRSEEVLRAAVEDVLTTFEQMRGYPEGDSGDPCFDLCGMPTCHEFGCLHMKVRSVRAAIASVSTPQVKPRGKCSCPYDGCDPCEYCRTTPQVVVSRDVIVAILKQHIYPAPSANVSCDVEGFEEAADAILAALDRRSQITKGDQS